MSVAAHRRPCLGLSGLGLPASRPAGLSGRVQSERSPGEETPASIARRLPSEQQSVQVLRGAGLLQSQAQEGAG